MNDEFILHYGMQKTGSASIQNYLYSGLNDNNFHWVDLGIDRRQRNPSRLLATAFKIKPQRHHLNNILQVSEDDISFIREQVVSNINENIILAKGKNKILSAESLTSFNLEDLSKLVTVIKTHNLFITAVGYIRSPKSYMESALQQRIKGWIGEKAYICNTYPHYKKRFEKFETLLGRDKVQYWPFSPREFTDGCVVQDFCTRLGISYKKEDVSRINDGISHPAIALLYTYRKFGPGYGKGVNAVRENTKLVECLAKLPGPKLRLHSSVVEPILTENRDDIAWMEERLGSSLSDSFIDDDPFAIRSEEELINNTPESVQWLAEQLGGDYPNICKSDMTPQEVANWMHLLRIKLAEKANMVCSN